MCIVCCVLQHLSSRYLMLLARVVCELMQAEVLPESLFRRTLRSERQGKISWLTILFKVISIHPLLCLKVFPPHLVNTIIVLPSS